MSRHRAPGQITNRWQGPAMRRAARGGVAVALVASGVVACTTSGAPPQPRTVPVQRTEITSGVSATGSLTSITEQNLGFTRGGQLTAVKVKVGDRVTAGQVLATIDPFPAQQALDQAQAQLDAQRAGLTRITASPVVGGARDSLSQAREILDRTKKQADAVQSADSVAIDNARRQLSQDKKAQGDAEDALDRDQSSCGSATSSLAALTGSTGGRSGSKKHDDTGSSGSGSAGPAITIPTALPTISPGTIDRAVGAIGALIPPPAACQAAAQDGAAVQSAKRAVVADRGAVDTAEERKKVDDESGRLQVSNAEQAVVSAQNNANSLSSDRPSNIAAQAAQVSAAQATVDSAVRDVDNTTLRAPGDGVVSALNGNVGEFVAPSASTSALAPGSGASLPGTDGAAGAGGAAGAAAGAASPSRPGGTQFLVLDNLDEYQVVLAFTETDAAAIASGQKVRLTFDAVPDLTLDGSVLSVSPTGTAISGVISYYVTVVLPKSDPRLRSGMTAQAEVLTQEITGVLAVPSAALHRENGTSVVAVLDPNGTQRSVTVEPGAVGDGNTQVVSGLRDGQQVVLPGAP